ncbi:MAG: c-type cytochrome [Desulfovibrio sp.]
MKKFITSCLPLMLILTLSTVPVFANDAVATGKALYSTCKGCHGSDGSRPALGTGKPIQGQTTAAIEEKLQGYKKGTYGGRKKSVMMGLMKNLGDDKIKALSAYISTLE